MHLRNHGYPRIHLFCRRIEDPSSECHMQWGAQPPETSTNQEPGIWQRAMVNREVQGNGKATTVGSSYNFCRPIRELSLSEMIKECDGWLIHCRERRLKRWLEQFAWPTTTMDLSSACNWDKQVLMSRPSEMEVIRDLGFLKRRKVSPAFMEYSGKALKSE